MTGDVDVSTFRQIILHLKTSIRRGLDGTTLCLCIMWSANLSLSLSLSLPLFLSLSHIHPHTNKAFSKVHSFVFATCPHKHSPKSDVIKTHVILYAPSQLGAPALSEKIWNKVLPSKEVSSHSLPESCRFTRTLEGRAIVFNDNMAIHCSVEVVTTLTRRTCWHFFQKVFFSQFFLTISVYSHKETDLFAKPQNSLYMDNRISRVQSDDYAPNLWATKIFLSKNIDFFTRFQSLKIHSIRIIEYPEWVNYTNLVSILNMGILNTWELPSNLKKRQTCIFAGYYTTPKAEIIYSKVKKTIFYCHIFFNENFAVTKRVVY